MRFFGIASLAALVAAFALQQESRAETTNAPDFKQVYDLIRANAAGVTETELNRAAVAGLLRELRSKVTLVTNGVAVNDAGEIPLVAEPQLFDGEIAYFRIGRVEDGLAKEMSTSYQALKSTNKLKGIVLDLRYTAGLDYKAAADAVDLFLANGENLLLWANQTISAHDKTDAIRLPVAVLVNRETSGAAEVLAALMRETGSGLILGGKTAGRAMLTKDFPLESGQELRVSTAPITLANGTKLTAEGLKPDIDVSINADDERKYYADAFRVISPTNLFGSVSLSLTNQPPTTNRTRIRFNEAELVRERRQGGLRDADAPVPEASPEKPLVNDPVLARALDLLKGLAVVRQSRF